jgi:hypothetical protein
MRMESLLAETEARLEKQFFTINKFTSTAIYFVTRSQPFATQDCGLEKVNEPKIPVVIGMKTMFTVNQRLDSFKGCT